MAAKKPQTFESLYGSFHLDLPSSVPPYVIASPSQICPIVRHHHSAGMLVYLSSCVLPLYWCPMQYRMDSGSSNPSTMEVVPIRFPSKPDLHGHHVSLASPFPRHSSPRSLESVNHCSALLRRSDFPARYVSPFHHLDCRSYYSNCPVPIHASSSSGTSLHAVRSTSIALSLPQACS